MIVCYHNDTYMKLKEIFNLSLMPAIIASLCCLSPLILVLAGFASISFAASLATTLYGTYKWWFRIAGLILLGMTTVLYLRRNRGICTINEVKKRRNEIINIVALSVIGGVVSYIIFLYVIVHYTGAWLGIWAY